MVKIAIRRKIMRYFLNAEKVKKYLLRYKSSEYLLAKLNHGEKILEINGEFSSYDSTWMEDWDGLEFFKINKNKFQTKDKSLIILDAKMSFFDIKENK